MGPTMFLAMCRDIQLVEPTGPMSIVTLGIMFTLHEVKESVTYII